MVKPGTAAAAAVPRSLTTPRSALPICLAVSGENHLPHDRRRKCRSTVFPSVVVIDLTIRGVMNFPPLAIVAIANVICNGVTADLVAHRNARDGNLAPVLRRSNRSGDFAGQFDPRAFAKTKAPDVFVKFLVAQADGQLGCADVARFHQNVLHAQLPVRACDRAGGVPP